MLLALLLTTLLTLAACDSGSVTEPDPDPRVTGTWDMSFTGSGSTITMELLLEENANGQLFGSGTVNLDGTEYPAPMVTGQHVHPDVNFTVEFLDESGLSFDGTLNDAGTQMKGTISGGNVTFYKQ